MILCLSKVVTHNGSYTAIDDGAWGYQIVAVKGGANTSCLLNYFRANNAIAYSEALSEIYPQCFMSCSSLYTASFPMCEVIGSSAFRGCSFLISAEFLSCKEVNASAFNGCTELISIAFPQCESLGSHAFEGCVQLVSAALPMCKTLGSYTFYGCSRLGSVDLLKCKSFGAYAFYSCWALQEISIPECEMLNQCAFVSCTHLKNIYLLGSSVTSLASTDVFLNTPLSLSTYLGYFGSIYVPKSLYADYVADSIWSFYSSRITSYVEEGG